MKVAIVGAGVSGLVAADRLGRFHDVTLFDEQRQLGGHARTVEVEVDGQVQPLDVGFMVFNQRNYPRFVELLDDLGVASRPTQMSFSVHAAANGFQYNGSSLAGLLARKRNLVDPGFYRMVRDILRFNREAPRLLNSPGGAEAEPTVEEFLSAGRYSREFADYYLLAMGSAIWSCPPGRFQQFPVRFIAEFFAQHGLLSLRDRPVWRVVEGGARTYVRALARRFHGRMRLSTRVLSVRRSAACVEIVTPSGVENYDHVIFACHSDQALAMLADPTPREAEILRCFPYQHSTALLHTDVRLLPSRRRAWASWNYLVRADDPRATVTYCLNILQHIRARETFCLTLNGEDLVAPDRVLERFEFAHPVFTTSRAAAQARHQELIGCHRTSYCGAYWRNGFHEDGVQSALAVCQALGAPAAWNWHEPQGATLLKTNQAPRQTEALGHA